MYRFSALRSCFMYILLYLSQLISQRYSTRATDFVFMAGYGMSQPVGHLDFYPNNGKEQPGCDLTEGPLIPLTLVKQGLEEASRVLVACNHVRAIKLFTESINGQCPYIGIYLLHFTLLFYYIILMRAISIECNSLFF